MKRWFDRLEKLYRVVGLICFVALTAIVGWQVFARYVLNDSPSWSEPLAMLLLLYAVLLGAAVGVRRDFHLGLRWLYQKLNPRFRRLADRMTLLVISGFGAGMVVYGLQMSAQTWSYAIPGLPVPMGAQYAALVAGGAAVAAFALEALLGHGDR
ncbi:MAG: TRAP transporter small permease [Proteobacteria bacterium]|nr:TRAP transporter small permease [Pseudomonadota bacterium]